MWDFSVDNDGMIAKGAGVGYWEGIGKFMADYLVPHDAVPPANVNLSDLLPTAMHGVTPFMTMQELEKFRILAVGQENRAAALAVGELILKKAHDAEGTLNNFAWALLTEEQYQDRFDELALRLSERSNEISGHRVWQYVDTLAWAKFKTGDAQAAVELEKKALALCDDEGDTAELKKALAEFEAALD